MDYAIIIWSLLVISLVTFLLYLKFGSAENAQVEPSLFENIHFMKAEVKEAPIRPRLLSQAKKKPSSKQDVKFNIQHESISDLLATLGIKDVNKLALVMQAFTPHKIGHLQKLNTLINLQESILVVQSGEVRLSVKDGALAVTRLIRDGGVIYSRLAIINYLLGIHSRPEEVPTLETTKSSVILVLTAKTLKSLVDSDGLFCSISRFVAEMQKLFVDGLYGELAVPMTALFKARKVIDDNTDLPQFLAKKLNHEDAEFFQQRLVKFTLNEVGDVVHLNGSTHDLGIVFVTKGTLNVHWTSLPQEPQFLLKNSWFGLLSMLSSPTGTPFPKSAVVEAPVEGYILTRSAFQQLTTMNPKATVAAAKQIFKLLNPLAVKLFYFFAWRTVKSGTKLYSKGENPHGTFAIIRGRLRSSDESSTSQDEESIMVGFFDSVLERPHSCSIVAARKSELAFIPNEVIRAIKDRYPTVQNKIVKVLGEQILEVWKAPKHAKANERPSAKVKTITLFGSSTDVPIPKVAANLVSGMSLVSVSALRVSSRKILSAALLGLKHSDPDPLSNPHLLAWLRDQERSFDVLIYQCDSTMTPWTLWCLSEADVVLDLCMASKGPFVTPMEKEVFQSVGKHCEVFLVLLHSPETSLPRGTADWLYRRKPFLFNHFHVKMTYRNAVTLHSDLSRIARHILGLDVGLVLGGGGGRGAAHVGMLQAILEAGIPIDRVGGVSIGAFIGGLWATHRDFAKLMDLAQDWFKVINNDWLGHIWNLTYPLASPFTGEFFNSTLKKTLGEHVMIEDLWLPYFCCSTDISVLGSKVHTTGWLWRYCRASMSYAWLLPPICDPRDGHLLIDGCYTDNVPGKVMKKNGVKYILALDVAAVDDRNLTNFGDALSGWWALYKKLNPFTTAVKIPDQTDIQLRLAFCSHYRNLEDLKKDPTYEYICPDLGSFTSSDFNKFEEIFQLGYNHASTYFTGMRKLQKPC